MTSYSPSYEVWKNRWSMAYDAACALGPRCKANSSPAVIDPPATEAQVREVENKLKVSLPLAFRETLLGFSRRVQVSWYCDPYDCKIAPPTEPIPHVFAGTCYWDLMALEQLDDARQRWAKVFSNPTESFDAVWQRQQVAFQQDGYGNLLALDLSPETSGAVVYLSHDPDEAHGYVLGRDFLDFMDRWTRVGCAGPHSWGWLPFTTGPRSLIDPDCQNARIWRQWVGFDNSHDDT